MKPRQLLISLLLLSVLPLTGQEPANPCEIQVIVLEKKAVFVKVPCVSKKDLVELVSTFFGRDDRKAKAKFRELLGESSEVTLQLSSVYPNAPEGKR